LQVTIVFITLSFATIDGRAMRNLGPMLAELMSARRIGPPRFSSEPVVIRYIEA
jgi:hypothetical protein